MRFLHTADWHLGRIFYGQYLTDDQAHVLENQFFTILKDEKIDGILLAGDIFDRAVPPIEAVELWDSIITRLAMDYKVPLFVVSGNHDGAERLEVGRSMLSQSGIHIWGSPPSCINNPLSLKVLMAKWPFALCLLASRVALGMH